MFKQPFTQVSLKAAIQIMEEISQSPCAKPFLNPVDPDLVPNYYQIISDPIDLTLIMENLLLSKYQTIDQWVSDVYRIKNNARKFNGDRSYIYSLSVVFCKKFDKRLREFYKFDHKIWINVYSIISRKLQKQMKQIPTKLTMPFQGSSFQSSNYDSQPSQNFGQTTSNHSTIDTRSSIKNSEAFSDTPFDYKFKNSKESPTYDDSAYLDPESNITKPKKVSKKEKTSDKSHPAKEPKSLIPPSYIPESSNTQTNNELLQPQEPLDMNQSTKSSQNYNQMTSMDEINWSISNTKSMNQQLNNQPDYFSNSSNSIRDQWPDSSFPAPNSTDLDSSNLHSNQKQLKSNYQTKSQLQPMQMPQNRITSTPPKSIFESSAEAKSIFNSPSNFNLPTFPPSPIAQEKSLFGQLDNLDYLPKELPQSEPTQIPYSMPDSLFISPTPPPEPKKTRITIHPPSSQSRQQSTPQNNQKGKQSKKSQYNQLQIPTIGQQQVPIQSNIAQPGLKPRPTRAPKSQIQLTSTPSQPSMPAPSQIQQPNNQSQRMKQQLQRKPSIPAQAPSQKKLKATKSQAMKQGTTSIANSPIQPTFPPSMRPISSSTGQIPPNGQPQRPANISNPNGMMMGQPLGQPMQYPSIPPQNDVILPFQSPFQSIQPGPPSQFPSMQMPQIPQTNDSFRMNMFDMDHMNYPGISPPELSLQMNDSKPFESKPPSQNDQFHMWPTINPTNSGNLGYPSIPSSQQLPRNPMNMRQMPGQQNFPPQQSMQPNMLMQNPMNHYIIP